MKAWQALLGSIFFVFIFQVAVPGFTELLYFSEPLAQPWVFITSCFLHGDIMHLFFNSFALLMFGPYLEREIGARNFVILFFLAGIAGNITYFLTIVMGIIPPVPALGASGYGPQGRGETCSQQLLYSGAERHPPGSGMGRQRCSLPV